MAKQSEHQLQVACLKWFRFQHRKYKDLLFAIPNGGKRQGSQGGWMVAEGLMKGVPDLFFARPSTYKFEDPLGKTKDSVMVAVSHGLFIEMKVKPNKPSKVQEEVMNNLRNSGYMVVVVYTFEEFKDLLDAYINLSVT